jgi:hypothetical protein
MLHEYSKMKELSLMVSSLQFCTASVGLILEQKHLKKLLYPSLQK